MENANLIALPGTKWDTGFLEDSSLRQLVLEYYDRERTALLRYVSFLGIDMATAEDVVQESFLRLHEHLLSEGDRSNLRAWLFRVAHNLSRNRQTAFHANKTDSLSELQGTTDPVAASESPEQALLESERESTFRQAVGQLSAAQRQCLVLRSQGFKYRQIADVLQLSLSTVAENVQRGMEQLRKKL
jgi:RNA polymerase sigma-70 factor, ECF subfamily